MSGFQIAANERHPSSSAAQPSDGFEATPLPEPDAGEKALAKLHTGNGKGHYAAGRYDLAIADFDQSINLDPQNAEAYNYRGLAYYAKADLRRAIADFGQALSLNPQLADAYYNRGSALSDRGQHESAIADFDRALAIDPGLDLAANRKWLAQEHLAAPSPKVQKSPKKRWFGLFSR